MRGDDDRQRQPEMWSYVPLEQRVPRDHPLRPMRTMVDAILAELSPAFDRIYSGVGRPSIAAPAARRPGQSDGELPWRAAQQRGPVAASSCRLRVSSPSASYITMTR
jgi:hypothetical protein